MIRKAKTQDLPRLYALYAIGRAAMRAAGNHVQWVPAEAPEDKLPNDIQNGWLYVVEDDIAIHGVFAFIVGDDPTYDYIEGGAWLDTATPYGTLHRMASDNAGHGVFREALTWAKAQMPHLRADTHELNALMRCLLESENFKYTGIIYEPDNTPRRAYEWLAEKQ